MYKTLSFLKSLDVVLPFFIFQYFYEIYKEFLVGYLIVRLNLAVNQQSEKFWYGIIDKVSMGEYGKESRSIDLENWGEYGWWGNWGIYGSLRSWVKYGGNMKGVGKCGGGIRDVGKYGEVWKSVWDECGGCGDVC